ncbi:MAG: FAD-dependent oxidoreductase [Christensenellales bacterium]
MSKVVIIGGVAGGASAAARLRRLDEGARIIILERGDHVSYANCGLPYYVGGVIEDREALLLHTPESLRERYDIDARVGSEVIAIDPAAHKVRVRSRGSEEVYEEGYDKLIIATGSSPVRPPIRGIDSPRVRTLWTVGDADLIHDMIKAQGIRSAAIIGGGFIGLEMAENLIGLGLEVAVVEMMDQVLAPLDYEMALPLHRHLREKGVRLSLDDGVDSFHDTGDAVTVTLKSGTELSAQLVILSIGVRPNSELARAAGLLVNARGGIVVDDHLLTSDPDIYAVGDVIQVRDSVFGDAAMIPLAGPANKQGRIAAANIMGADERYQGSLGSSVVQVFDMTAAFTGANEKALIRRGLVQGKDYERLLISQLDHAGYYPGGQRMQLKLLFAQDGSRIFGAQIVGGAGVDKRIDVIATAIRLGAPVRALAELELAYAPPFSSAKDPVNMAGFMAANVLDDQAAFAGWDVLEKHPNSQVLDVREPYEVAAYPIPRAVNIPLGQLRQRAGELDPARETIVFCAVGVRAHNAARLLRGRGMRDVLIYPGGAVFYEQTH